MESFSLRQKRVTGICLLIIGLCTGYEIEDYVRNLTSIVSISIVAFFVMSILKRMGQSIILF